MKRSVIEERGVSDDQIPPLLSGDRRQIVGMVNRDAPAQFVVCDSAPARRYRRRIDVRQAQRVALPVAEKRKSDEGRAGAPFERPRLLGHAPAFEEGGEFLTE